MENKSEPILGFHAMDDSSEYLLYWCGCALYSLELSLAQLYEGLASARSEFSMCMCREEENERVRKSKLERREIERERGVRGERFNQDLETYNFSSRSWVPTSTMSLGNRKLVVLGIPWDVDTEALREYMCQYGELDDVIVMKDRASGRSRGFGYVTFSTSEDAEKVMAAQHLLQGRALEVKVATPKEEMRPTSRKITRIFVARIPPSVTDELFRSYFEKYGTILDAYMPKDQMTKQHRGIGFVTYENPESVDKLMSENHELAGSTIAVDRATPKEDTGRLWERPLSGDYGAFSNYINASRFGGYGTAPFGGYDYGGPDLGATSMGNSYRSNYGASNMWPPGPSPPQACVIGGPSPRMLGTDPQANDYGSTAPRAAPPKIGKKLFVGRVPVEATTEDLRLYFSQYGRILDVYLPKDAKKISHRGFGFVTFAEESTAERVAQKRHEIHGHQIAVDRASPLDEIPHRGYYGNDLSSLNSLSGGAGVGGPSPGMSGVPADDYGSATAPPRLGKKIFVGRIPVEATTEDLKLYFSQYGRILDVYLPKDAKKISHRGFGFVTFAEESTAEHVAQKTHLIHGHQIAVDRASPLDETPSGMVPSNFLSGGSGGPLRGSSLTVPGSSYGNMPGDVDYNSGWLPYGGTGPIVSSDGAPNGHRSSRTELRYRPY